ncbi:WD40-repeat-containing domain protein, partial [Gautieria morchelliformis]
ERVLEGHRFEVSCIAFSPDGSLIASGSKDQKVRVWNVATGEQLHKLRHAATSVAFRPDGSHVVSRGKATLVWDIVTGDLILSHSCGPLPDMARLPQYVDPGLQFSPDYMWLLGESPMPTRWIAPEYRNISAHCFSGSKVCLGRLTGRVVVLDLNPQGPSIV